MHSAHRHHSSRNGWLLSAARGGFRRQGAQQCQRLTVEKFNGCKKCTDTRANQRFGCCHRSRAIPQVRLNGGTTRQAAYLMHRPHVDDAVPLSRYPEDLIQDLLHVQLLTLSKIKSVYNGGTFYPQLLQHSAPGGWKKQRQHSHKSCLHLLMQFSLPIRHCEKLREGKGLLSVRVCAFSVCRWR